MLCQHAPLISVQLGSKAGLAETHWPLYWVALHWGCTGFDASLKEIIAGLVLEAKLMLTAKMQWHFALLTPSPQCFAIRLFVNHEAQLCQVKR